MRGQCYDGAGSIAGKVKGAAARIRNEYLKALYVHCAAHILNLCVVKSVEVQTIRNMLGTMHGLTNFFHFSPKREALLQTKIVELRPQSTHTNLKVICKTRRVQRLDSLEMMVELREAIIETLMEIKTNEGRYWNQESTAKAKGLYHAIMNFEFLISMTVTRKTLTFTKGITVKLQSRSAYVLKIKAIKNVMTKICAEIEEYHHKWFEETSALAESLGIAVSTPRVCRIQRNRPNTPASTLEGLRLFQNMYHDSTARPPLPRDTDTVLQGHVLNRAWFKQ